VHFEGVFWSFQIVKFPRLYLGQNHFCQFLVFLVQLFVKVCSLKWMTERLRVNSSHRTALKPVVWSSDLCFWVETETHIDCLLWRLLLLIWVFERLKMFRVIVTQFYFDCALIVNSEDTLTLQFREL
jgi:hypothetical protein